MNSLTHALLGGLAGLLLFPGGTIAFAAGFAGGIFPDLDSLFGRHRRTLHFPWLYLAVTALTAIFTLFWSPFYLATVFFLSAWIHSATDVIAGGELRSWREEEWVEEAVYDHLRGNWIKPRRIIYSPSPRDAAVSGLAAAGIAASSPEPVVTLTAGLSFGFTLIYLVTVRYLNLVPQDYGTFNAFLRSKLGRLRRSVG